MRKRSSTGRWTAQLSDASSSAAFATHGFPSAASSPCSSRMSRMRRSLRRPSSSFRESSFYISYRRRDGWIATGGFSRISFTTRSRAERSSSAQDSFRCFSDVSTGQYRNATGRRPLSERFPISTAGFSTALLSSGGSPKLTCRTAFSKRSSKSCSRSSRFPRRKARRRTRTLTPKCWAGCSSRSWRAKSGWLRGVSIRRKRSSID